MSLQRLAVRTKKSLSGLYSSQKESTQVTSASNLGETVSKLPVTPPKTLRSTVDDFGILRSDENPSPGTDSPSRRQRLLGSLRSIKSLRTLRSVHSNSKKSEEEPDKTTEETPHTPVREKPSLSLNFEASPADEPMFDPMTRTTSGSSSLLVHHSSPITVPSASRHTTPMAQGTPPGLTTFAVGTIPDSPAPLQIASVQEAIINNATKGSPCPDSPPVDVTVDPFPTPMPGTNLPLDDFTAPGIMVTSPSAPSMQEYKPPGYFDSFIVPDENGCERTKTLDTESGFPTCCDARVGDTEATLAEPDELAILPCDAASAKPEAATSDGAPTAVPNDYPAIHASKALSGSNDYGSDLAYIVWDNPEFASAEKIRKQRPSNWSRLSGPYDGTGYGREATSSSHQWTDNTDAATTETTGFTEFTYPDDRASVAKLLAAMKELDAAILPAQPQSPADIKKSLEEIIRAYASPIFREGTEDDDISVRSGIALAEEGIREIREEVETSIRVMNRSLGG